MGFAGSSGTSPTLRSCLPSARRGARVAEATGPAVRRACLREKGRRREVHASLRAPRKASAGEGLPIDVVVRLAFATALHGLRASAFAGRAGPRGTVDRAARSSVKTNVRAPRDLGAVSPDGCPVRAARHRCRASSPGVVQRSPLHRHQSGSPLPAGCPAFGARQPASPVFRPRGFSPPRRLAPPRSRGLVASRCRSWGSSRFRPSRNELPRDAVPALRSLAPLRQLRLPADLEVALSIRVEPRVSRHRPRPFGPVRSPRDLALLTFLSPATPAVTRRDPSVEPGLQGLAPPSGPVPAPPLPAMRVRCSPGLVRALERHPPTAACAATGGVLTFRPDPEGPCWEARFPTRRSGP